MSVKLGLENIGHLLSAINNPHHGLKVIHVAGTNGKGSICAALSSILTLSGYKTGRFNSPHLLHPSDAIRINDKPVQHHEYASTISKILTTSASKNLTPTPFETQTAAALHLFRENNVDIAVLEVGLGGRLDATNICDPPLACVFASIGLDHVEFLGDTIPKIAREKAGIIKPGASVVIAPQANPEAAEVILSVAHDKRCDAVVVQPAVYDAQDPRYAIMEYEGRELRFPMPLLGDFQLGNMAAAIKTLEILQGKGFAVSDDQIIQGLQQLRWPGRLEWIDVLDLGKILVDGAHNAAAAKELGRFVCAQRVTKSSRVAWVVGMTKGKDAVGLFNQLLKEGDVIHTVPFTQPDQMPWIHSAEAETLRSSAQKVLPSVGVRQWVGIQQALAGIKEDRDRAPLVVICGSLYLVADLYRLLGREP
ncbi:hypothetical protein HDV00_007038 [Rhizophlyctis rosea]|nr:hypothetical protein HDV00_007038 [Rhizophlyctis rosea]